MTLESELETIRTNIVTNLTSKGVTASNTESLNDLVGKVNTVKTPITSSLVLKETYQNDISGVVDCLRDKFRINLSKQGVETLSTDGLTTLSNSISLIIIICLYAPLLDGTESKASWGNTDWIISNGQAGGNNCAGVLSAGWDNNVNWKLQVEAFQGNWSGGMIVTPTIPNSFGFPNALSTSDGYFEYNGTRQSMTYNCNAWNTIILTKTDNNLNIKVNGTDKGTISTNWNNYTKMYIGTNGWDGYGTHYIRNIRVVKI